MTTISLHDYLEQVNELLNEGKIGEVSNHCRHILQHYPRHVATYRALAQALLEYGNYADAIDLFHRVLSANPNDFVSHLGLAVIYEDQLSFPQSIWHMEIAYEMKPYDVTVQKKLRDLLKHGDFAVPERLPLSQGALARIYLQGELYQQAVVELQKALALDRERIDLDVLLAETYWRNNQRVEAVEACRKILEKLPNCIQANAIMAETWLRTGRTAEAQEYLENLQDLTQIDVDHCDIETAVGRAFRANGSQHLPESVEIEYLEITPGSDMGVDVSADWVDDALFPEDAGEVASAESDGMFGWLREDVFGEQEPSPVKGDQEDVLMPSIESIWLVDDTDRIEDQFEVSEEELDWLQDLEAATETDLTELGSDSSSFEPMVDDDTGEIGDEAVEFPQESIIDLEDENIDIDDWIPEKIADSDFETEPPDTAQLESDWFASRFVDDVEADQEDLTISKEDTTWLSMLGEVESESDQPFEIPDLAMSDLTVDESDDVVPDWLIPEAGGERGEDGDLTQGSETQQTVGDDANVDEEVPDWLATGIFRVQEQPGEDELSDMLSKSSLRMDEKAYDKTLPYDQDFGEEADSIDVLTNEAVEETFQTTSDEDEDLKQEIEELPGWLLEDEEDTGGKSEIMEQTIKVPDLSLDDIPRKDDDFPDWLVSDEREAESEVKVKDDQLFETGVGIPNWLAGEEVDEPGDTGLLQPLELESESDLDYLSQGEIPEWLLEDEPEDETEPEAIESEGEVFVVGQEQSFEGSGDVPDWFSAVEDDDSVEGELEMPLVEESEKDFKELSRVDEDFPDWLLPDESDYQEEIEVLASKSEGSFIDQGQVFDEDEDVPDWLLSEGLETLEEFELEKSVLGKKPMLNTDDVTEGIDGLPDWLSGDEFREQAESEIIKPEIARQDDVLDASSRETPDWLMEHDQEGLGDLEEIVIGDKDERDAGHEGISEDESPDLFESIGDDSEEFALLPETQEASISAEPGQKEFQPADLDDTLAWLGNMSEEDEPEMESGLELEEFTGTKLETAAEQTETDQELDDALAWLEDLVDVEDDTMEDHSEYEELPEFEADTGLGDDELEIESELQIETELEVEEDFLEFEPEFDQDEEELSFWEMSEKPTEGDEELDDVLAWLGDTPVEESEPELESDFEPELEEFIKGEMNTPEVLSEADEIVEDELTWLEDLPEEEGEPELDSDLEPELEEFIKSEMDVSEETTETDQELDDVLAWLEDMPEEVSETGLETDLELELEEFIKSEMDAADEPIETDEELDESMIWLEDLADEEEQILQDFVEHEEHSEFELEADKGDDEELEIEPEIKVDIESEYDEDVQELEPELAEVEEEMVVVEMAIEPTEAVEEFRFEQEVELATEPELEEESVEEFESDLEDIGERVVMEAAVEPTGLDETLDWLDDVPDEEDELLDERVGHEEPELEIEPDEEKEEIAILEMAVEPTEADEVAVLEEEPTPEPELEIETGPELEADFLEELEPKLDEEEEIAVMEAAVDPTEADEALECTLAWLDDLTEEEAEPLEGLVEHEELPEVESEFALVDDEEIEFEIDLESEFEEDSVEELEQELVETAEAKLVEESVVKTIDGDVLDEVEDELEFGPELEIDTEMELESGFSEEQEPELKEIEDISGMEATVEPAKIEEAAEADEEFELEHEFEFDSEPEEEKIDELETELTEEGEEIVILEAAMESAEGVEMLDDTLAWLDSLADEEGELLQELADYEDSPTVEEEARLGEDKELEFTPELETDIEEDLEGFFDSEVEVPEDIDDAMAWLEGLAVKQGAPIEELPSLTTLDVESEEEIEPIGTTLEVQAVEEVDLDSTGGMADVPEDLDDAMAWLEELAARQGAPVEELPSIADLIEREEEMQANTLVAESEAPSQFEVEIESDFDEIDLGSPIEITDISEDLDDAMAWLGDLEEKRDVSGEALLGIVDSIDDEVTVEPEDYVELTIEAELEEYEETDELVTTEPTGETADVEEGLDKALAWLEGLEDEEEIPFEEMDEDIVDEILSEPEFDVETPEIAEPYDDDLREALDWVEQVAFEDETAAEDKPTEESVVEVSEEELTEALNWLDQLVLGEETAETPSLDDGDLLLETRFGEAVEKEDIGIVTEGEIKLPEDMGVDSEAPLLWIEKTVEEKVTEQEKILLEEDEEEEIDIGIDILDSLSNGADSTLDWVEQLIEGEEISEIESDIVLDETDAQFDETPENSLPDVQIEEEATPGELIIKPTFGADDDAMFELSVGVSEGVLEDGFLDDVPDDPEAALAWLEQFVEGDLEEETESQDAGEISSIDETSKEDVVVPESLEEKESEPAELVIKPTFGADEDAMYELSVGVSEGVLEDGFLDDVPDDPEAALVWLEQFLEGEEISFEESSERISTDEETLIDEADAEPEPTNVPTPPRSTVAQLAIEVLSEMGLEVDDDFLENIPEDPDEAVAYLQQFVDVEASTELNELISEDESDPIVDEAEKFNAADVDDDLLSGMPDDPDAAMAWLQEIADEQEGVLDETPFIQVDEDSKLLEEEPFLDEMAIDASVDDLLAGVIDDEEDELGDFDELLEEDSILPSEEDEEFEDINVHFTKDLSDSLPEWLSFEPGKEGVADQTDWLSSLPEPDIAGWLEAEEDATVSGIYDFNASMTQTETRFGTGPLPTLEPMPEPDDDLLIRPEDLQRGASEREMDISQMSLARQTLQGGNFDEAIDVYQSLIDEGEGLGKLIAELEDASNKFLEQPLLRRVLGDAYMRNGQLQKALDSYRLALDRM